MKTPDDEFGTVAASLASDGWCVVDPFLPRALTLALAGECAAMHAADLLRPARVGSDRDVSHLRGDRTHWFATETMSAPQQAFAERIDVLRVELSRRLMLGLVDSESHYAVYRPGTGYARHRDRLRDTDARVLSAVFYLNADWLPEHGGALRLYLDDHRARDILPIAGTLVLFLSETFEHEVLPATRDRMSIACWMRQRAM